LCVYVILHRSMCVGVSMLACVLAYVRACLLTACKFLHMCLCFFNCMQILAYVSLLLQLHMYLCFFNCICVSASSIAYVSLLLQLHANFCICVSASSIACKFLHMCLCFFNCMQIFAYVSLLLQSHAYVFHCVFACIMAYVFNSCLGAKLQASFPQCTTYLLSLVD